MGAKPLKADLEAVRARIDAVDEEIHRCLNERARLAQQVGMSKAAGGRAVDFYRPEREAQVLRAARKRNAGPLRDAEVLRLFREIMSACLAQQEPLKVAFLGPEGTFTQTAVLNHFGHSVRALPLASIDEVFHEVEAANADFGVVPIENSTEGTVNHTLDRFLTSPLKICGEVELRIRQHLMGSMSALSRIARVCSHPQSLAQCREWLDEHLPGSSRCRCRATPRRAARARRAGHRGDRRRHGGRGVRPEGAGGRDRGPRRQHHALPGARAQAVFPEREDRTTLLVSVLHTDAPGALYRLLEPLARHRVSLTRIESRPSRRRKWDYVFFIDFEGHAEDSTSPRRSRRSKSAPRCAASSGPIRGRCSERSARRALSGRPRRQHRRHAHRAGRQVDLAPCADARRAGPGRDPHQRFSRRRRIVLRPRGHSRPSACASSGRAKARYACTAPAPVG